MKSLKLLLSAAILAGAPVAAQAHLQGEDRFVGVEITTTDLGNGLHMLVGAGGNIGVSVGEDGVFMIDSQFAPLSDKIKAAIAGLSDKPVEYLINTHWHGDHTGGNSAFHESGSMIVAHDNVRDRLSEDQEVFGRPVPASPESAWPGMTYSDRMTIYVNDLQAVLFHIPNAHTDGDTLVFFPSANVLHMGDTFFNGGYPFVDLDSGGSLLGVIEAVDDSLDIIDENTKVIPGHGPLADIAALTEYYDMLVIVRDRIQALIDEGKSLEEAVAADPLKDLNEKWGQGFIKGDQIVTFAYRSLLPPPAEEDDAEMDDEDDADDAADGGDDGGLLQ